MSQVHKRFTPGQVKELLERYCNNEIERGTGKIFVEKSGKALYFCSMKCEKNLLKLKRKPRKTKWTGEYRKAKKA